MVLSNETALRTTKTKQRYASPSCEFERLCSRMSALFVTVGVDVRELFARYSAQSGSVRGGANTSMPFTASSPSLTAP